MARATAASAPRSQTRDWSLWFLLAFAVAGVGIAAYLTVVHYSSVPLACPTSGVVDCGLVTRSPYSVIPWTTIPITVLGLGWFLVSGTFTLAAFSASPPSRLPLVHFAWGALGLVYIVWLVFAEIALLHHLCEWCSAEHLLVLATFLVTLRRLQNA